MHRRTFLRLPVRPVSQPRIMAGLEPYAGPWDRRQATHLIRRTGFGAIKREVDGAFFDGSASAAVDRLVEDALADPLPEAPSWYGGSSSSGINEIYDLQRSWLDAMRARGLIEKMTLFWHNHFVTQHTSIDQKTSLSTAHLVYDYYTLLRKNALGNFRTLVEKIGTNPAMLIYLDGFVNERGKANENYARELLELFTMGQFGPDGSENYTEADIKEIARALTGWVVTSDRKASFDPARHDDGVKTFWGTSGAFGYDDVVATIFEKRAEQAAHFVCRKLYTFFVQALPDEAVVSALAAEMLAQDFEIAPVLKKLLKSAHFYDDAFIGARIKSPVEYLVGFLREAEVVPTQDLLEGMREALTPINLAQELFNPPNVAGWPGLNPPDAGGAPGHYAWLTTTALPERWAFLSDLVYGNGGADYDPLELVTKISDPSDPFQIAVDLAETMIPIPLEEAAVRDVPDDLVGMAERPPPEDILNGPPHVLNLSKILLDGLPHYGWPIITDLDDPDLADARALVRGYLGYLIQLPAYQLM
ncbi:DUF1800 domain-containing protein [Rhodocaloribacter sp.]